MKRTVTSVTPNAVLKQLSPIFRNRIIAAHGELGEEWLEDLPTLLEKYFSKWSLTELRVVPFLSCNLVLQGLHPSYGTVILKTGVLGADLRSELQSLRLFDGHGCVKLLESSPSEGIFLLEGLMPGEMLDGQEETEALSICGGVIRRLHERNSDLKVLNSCRQLDSYLSEFRKLHGVIRAKNIDFDLSLLGLAESEFEELLATSVEKKLLHGDLHHFNILSSHRDRWLAIDPLGLVGDPAYECAAFLRNPYMNILERPNIREVLKHRIRFLSRYLEQDERRIARWGFAQTVLAAGWFVQEDVQEWKNWHELAKIFP